MRLSSLGLQDLEERVYEMLLIRPALTSVHLADSLRADRQLVEEAIALLESRGFVVRGAGTPPVFEPVSPDIAVASLVPRKIQELENLRREAIDATATLSTRRTKTTNTIDVVTGTASITQFSSNIEQSAVREVRLIDAPAYIVPAPGPNKIELGALARGVEYRVLYHTSAFSSPEKLEAARICVAAGEHARVYSGVPMKLVIADRQLAMMYETEQVPDQTSIVIRPSFIMDAVELLFERLWEMATPFLDESSGKTAQLAAIDREVVTLLAAGMSDDQIASAIGSGLRTVGRRVAALMAQLNAKTRFQAGVRAAQQGFIK